MYESLYEPVPDISRYLDRLRIKPPHSPGKDSLDALVYAHQCRIPFENLDVFALHRTVSLGTADIFRKVIVNRRGGYCFELNALFTQLLKDLGYNACACMCRILRNKDFTPPVLHRGILVEIKGQKYFCDVGYGGPAAPGSLPVQDGTTTCFGREQYHINRTDDYWWTISRTTSSGQLEKIMQFYLMPQENVDFLAMNEYCSRNPASTFTQKLFLNIRTAGGSNSILGDTFTKTDGDTTEVTTIKCREQFFDIIQNDFYLDPLSIFQSISHPSSAS